MNANSHAAIGVDIGIPRPSDVGEKDIAGSAAARVQRVQFELDELKSTLAASKRQLKVTRQKIHALTIHNSILMSELVQLAQNETRVHALAYYDELTGLPNRRLLLDRLNQAIAQGARQRKLLGLILLDLDGFKGINDKHGHTTGDTLLHAVAKRLTTCIRACDTACRYGGDEFVVMLPELDDRETASAVAKKISANLAKAYVVDGREVMISASVGTAIYPIDGEHYTDLLKQADIAMYRSKARNGSAECA